MRKTYSSGKNGDYAEIIIDYEKKNVKMINPKDDKPFKDKRFRLQRNLLVFLILAVIFVLLSYFNVNYSWWILAGIYFTHCGVGIIFPKYYEYVEKLNQHLSVNRLGGQKKIVIIKRIKGRIWQLPYPFYNNKLDYKLTGEFARFIKKVHIKPKDYYVKRNGKIEKQIEEWDAFFYFSRSPKKGKMEIEWS